MCVMTKIQCKFLHKTRLPDIVPYNEHDKSVNKVILRPWPSEV